MIHHFTENVADGRVLSGAKGPTMKPKSFGCRHLWHEANNPVPFFYLYMICMVWFMERFVFKVNFILGFICSKGKWSVILVPLLNTVMSSPLHLKKSWFCSDKKKCTKYVNMIMNIKGQNTEARRQWNKTEDINKSYCCAWILKKSEECFFLKIFVGRTAKQICDSVCKVC